MGSCLPLAVGMAVFVVALLAEVVAGRTFLLLGMALFLAAGVFGFTKTPFFSEVVLMIISDLDSVLDSDLESVDVARLLSILARSSWLFWAALAFILAR